MQTQKPVLLFYCQHSLGMGHLVRALTLAETLAQKFTVVFLNGGRFPDNIQCPADLEVINLPPIGMDEANQLYSQNTLLTLTEAQAQRKQAILKAFNDYRPSVILIELFPFGRKKFAGELMPLLKAARRHQNYNPLVLCSLRDIMVNARKDQLRHDNRARWLIDRYFDGILVHSDPKFASLEESFKPSKELTSPVFYTGFVLPRQSEGAVNNRVNKQGIIVSAGGGMVGAALLKLAASIQPVLWQKHRLPMTIVAGPFLPQADWQDLLTLSTNRPGLVLHRHVPDMAGLLAEHRLSLSQCGYNTVMDILKAGIPALVVPFAQGQEDEQTNRAQRLSQLGLLRHVAADGLNAEILIREIEQTLGFTPDTAVLNLNGAQNTAEIITQRLTNTFVNLHSHSPVKQGLRYA